jgi:hypothetical protein
MSAILALASPILPYLIAGLVALIGGGGYVWNAKRKARNEGIAEQQAKEAAANAKDIDIIQRAADARPVGGVLDDPNNRDNAKG